jgi:hypothetical protein
MITAIFISDIVKKFDLIENTPYVVKHHKDIHILQSNGIKQV